tara:strand:+ start:921 stop:1241 length:321 start_codon:yes stop_codon:yes gene_type:complete
MEFPDELWRHIKEYSINGLFLHKKKLNHTLLKIDDLFQEIFIRYSSFPPFQNTNDIIRHTEIFGNCNNLIIPRPNLPLTSITWNIKSNKQGGWWCGYGWIRKDKLI